MTVSNRLYVVLSVAVAAFLAVGLYGVTAASPQPAWAAENDGLQDEAEAETEAQQEPGAFVPPPPPCEYCGRQTEGRRPSRPRFGGEYDRQDYAKRGGQGDPMGYGPPRRGGQDGPMGYGPPRRGGQDGPMGYGPPGRGGQDGPMGYGPPGRDGQGGFMHYGPPQGGGGPPHMNPEKLFDEMDSDKDGKLTKEEFVEFHEQRQSQHRSRETSPRGLRRGPNASKDSPEEE